MDRDRILLGYSQPVGHPTARSPPGYPGVQLNPLGGNQQGVYLVGACPQDGSIPPPNPGFKPNISEQNKPGVAFNDPGHAASAGDLGEDGEMKTFDFTDKTIRKAFIRKVYTILMMQLLVTMSFIAWFMFHRPTKYWVQRHHAAVIVTCLVLLIAFLLVMVCSKKSRRTYPTNFILLGLFTVSMSVILGCVTSLMKTDVVMMAVGITAAVCLALTLFALQTKWDFTAVRGAFCICLTVLTLFGLLCAILRTTYMRIVYASFGAIVFSFYLIYDTQRMMGGNHKYSITPEEYIFAALALYLDVTRIFLFILRIIKAVRT